MTQPFPIDGQRFTVIGAARSGLAAANHLAAHGGDVLLVDHKGGLERPPGLHPDAAFEAGTNRVRPGDVAIMSPGIPEVSPVRQTIARQASEVMGEMELFARLCPGPLLAVTGTDGKSTVTTMLGQILRAAGRTTFVGGNLGNPLTEDLDAMNATTLAVAEVSCFQLTSCDTFHPTVAVVTNIAVDHVDYHGSFEAYQAAKRRVARQMTPSDALVLNGDDPHIALWQLETEATTLRFSAAGDMEADAYFSEGSLWVGGALLFARDVLPLFGVHNVANALAAALAARAFGVSMAHIHEGLRTYEALPHRLRWVRDFQQVRYINDSKATNPNAASAGLLAMDRPTVLIAGGSDKDADFTAFGQVIRDRSRLVILFGQTQDALADAVGPTHPTHRASNLEEALVLARTHATPGDVVLLSPACASFDQFRSFAHRGEVFESLVGVLKA